MISNILLPVGVTLLMIGIIVLALLFNEQRSRQQHLVTERQQLLGLPEGELVYEDANGKGETLSSDQFPLAGKPDYVIKLPDGRPVPIELKLSSQGVKVPYSNHVLQLAAYCLILEDYFDAPPTHGILRYADRDFTVDYTPALRKKVISTLTEMEDYSEQEPPLLTKQKAAKCRACIFQPVCPIGNGK